MEESKRDSGVRGGGPRQKEELLPKKKGATFVTWTWFVYEKSDTGPKKSSLKMMLQTDPHSRLKLY